MRARLALLMGGLTVEIREVSLKNKPAEMLSISPKGTVPVLQLPDGAVIDESWEIMLWTLGNHNADAWAATNNADVIKAAQLLVNENDNVFKPQLDRYKYSVGYPEHPMEYYRDQGEKFLANLEKNLANSSDFLGAN